MLKPIITTYGWVPGFARGLARDLRARWACEEEGITYDINPIDWATSKGAEYRHLQPFGQIPAYRDDEIQIFESGAIVLRIAELGSKLLPIDPAARMQAIQWLIASLNSIEPWILRATAESAAANDDKRGDGMKASGGMQAESDLDVRLNDLDAAIANKPWLDGKTFTVGDLMMISVLGGLRNTDALSKLPNLKAYVARGESRSAYVKALNDQSAMYEAEDRIRASA